MLARAVTLVDYRNIEKAYVRFGEGVNLLVGDNAQGKTNLLESIYFFALGKSFRGAKEAELVRFGTEISTMALDFTAGEREQTAIVRLAKGRRSVELNHVKLGRMSELIGQFRAVLFCPEHLALVKEGPAMRRNYLDVAISQLKPIYLRALQRYNVILRERNKLLKTADEQPAVFRDTIDLWSAQLAEQAGIIARERMKYVTVMCDIAFSIFDDMTHEREMALYHYAPGFHLEPDRCFDEKEVEKHLYGLLTQHLDREKAAGMTLWGPHRDDIEITLNKRSARLYASQGQQRSLALAMKLAEGEICLALTGERPVFLFDDVLSELDASRRGYLTREFKGRQVIMTTCERAVFPDAANVISVRNGRFG